MAQGCPPKRDWRPMGGGAECNWQPIAWPHHNLVHRQAENPTTTQPGPQKTPSFHLPPKTPRPRSHPPSDFIHRPSARAGPPSTTPQASCTTRQDARDCESLPCPALNPPPLFTPAPDPGRVPTLAPDSLPHLPSLQLSSQCHHMAADDRLHMTMTTMADRVSFISTGSPPDRPMRK